MTNKLGLNAERIAPDSNVEGVAESVQGQDNSSEVSEAAVEALLNSSALTSTGNGPTLEAFNASLNLFIHHTEMGMTAARTCADMSITHFYIHGDTTYFVRFLEAMRTKGKNYVRQAAYQKWVLDFSPVEIVAKEGAITITKNKLRADRMWPDAVAKQDLLDKALSKPFWEHAPDKEVVRFGKLDLLLAIKKTVEKYEDEDRYAAASTSATQTITAAKLWVDAQLG